MPDRSVLERLSRIFERLLAGLVGLLLVTLTVIVVVAVVYRRAGHSLVWYDEVASVLLAWLTYYGAALAALKRAHIGFSGLVDSFPVRLRLAAVLFAEICVIGFFALLAWTGWQVLQVLQGMHLVSLPWVPVQLTQSVIPIGAALFIVAQLLSLPEVLRRTRQGAPSPGRTPVAERAVP
jgi:TRAP-type C4-dicarboxylate transport system permease small subunit